MVQGGKLVSLILASASPRRKELLAREGYDFEVIVSDVDEVVNHDDPPHKIAMSIASQKALAVSEKFPSDVVLGADTIVVCNEEILGKPKSREDAARMLRMLSGRSHHVYTGVCLATGAQTECFFECTEVRFRPLSDDEIYDYIDGGEPMDKAGAYGIQGDGGKFVTGLGGSLSNVIGLPVEALVPHLDHWHIPKAKETSSTSYGL